MYQNETYILLLEFMHKGGPVMWLIALLALVLWALVFERLWYLSDAINTEKAKNKQAHVIGQVMNQGVHIAPYLKQIMLSEKQYNLAANLNLIKTLVLLCPLLGLLGTVSGMIAVFDVIAFGNMGDVKLMADGVSKATIPTMASMVVSISGIFAHAYLTRRVNKHKQWQANDLAGDNYA